MSAISEAYELFQKIKKGEISIPGTPTMAKPVQSIKVDHPKPVAKPQKATPQKRMKPPVIKRIHQNGKTEVVLMKKNVFAEQQQKLSNMPLEFQTSLRASFDLLGVDMSRLPIARINTMEKILEIAQQETKSNDPQKLLNWFRDVKKKMGLGFGADNPEATIYRLLRMR